MADRTNENYKKNIDRIGYFFKINKSTKEKKEYINNVLNNNIDIFICTHKEFKPIEARKVDMKLDGFDKVEDSVIPIHFDDEPLQENKKYKVLSLFSGCGGMDLGFEGHFTANKKSFAADSPFIERQINDNWVFLKKTLFQI